MTVDAVRKQNQMTGKKLDFDAIVIGAGISGLYELHLLRDRYGLNVKVFEAGTGVGGTWYWNRYPGCRFDSESWSYGYSFNQEILAEWNWTEHFAPQPETERYLNFVADKLDLRKNIQFSARVKSAHYDDNDESWTVTLENGESYRSRYFVTCVGPLSAPTYPKFDGIESFEGESCHTGLWPKHKVSFEGKRVAVIGTGATGVQTIQEVAKTAKHLTVFQRRPNWCTPLHNGPISSEEMEEIRGRYPEIFRLCKETASCFVHNPDPRKTLETPEAERNAFLQNRYETPGFGIWMGNFKDMLTDRDANKVISDFVAERIRERVKDPATAEKLIPTDHGFGTRRVPQETFYYEVYNQPNVELISMLETPIERITPKGLETSDRSFEFDIIIYATGFDAITGSFDRIDIQGADGIKLKDKWKGGPTTYLGMMVKDFPNMFMVIGPHTALGNIPRSIEHIAEWVAGAIHHMHQNGITFADPTQSGVDEWTDYVAEVGEGLLSNEIDSWMTGINLNVEGKQTRILARYSGSAVEYRRRCDKIAKDGYTDVTFTSRGGVMANANPNH